ncbi:MAG: DUF2884 family protein [Rhodanobacter sp.]|nr:MAG: DUF2884 family protein [Rhodanobacter sp.]TAL98168.1 MAG: DUF2884 family protein [Rhodanobacter sp.]TAM40349.1 MAG: DUF2884 family protein [Rhodanobacter sp.]
MRSWLPLVTLLSLLVASPLRADDLATVCHATSSYDMTLRADSLLFDRSARTPLRVVIAHGSLHTDGTAVPLDPEQYDRLVLFDRDVRALVPRVRKVAQNGVDMAVQALRAEVADLGLSADTRATFDSRLNARAAELKQRIASSQSTHDWQGDAMRQYANQVAGDLMPLLAADLGQQAVNAALAGDLQEAASLRERASSLATGLQPRLQQRMQALRAQIAALCPAIQQLGRLQQGVRDNRGRPLDLLQISR